MCVFICIVVVVGIHKCVCVHVCMCCFYGGICASGESLLLKSFFLNHKFLLSGSISSFHVMNKSKQG